MSRCPSKVNNEEMYCSRGVQELIGTMKIIAACALFYWAGGRKDHKKARKPGFLTDLNRK
jgi:hypothetical protein